MMEISLFVVAGVLMYASLFVAWRAVDALQRANRRLMGEVADLRARVWRLEADARKTNEEAL